jgi:hypothetical protein
MSAVSVVFIVFVLSLSRCKISPLESLVLSLSDFVFFLTSSFETDIRELRGGVLFVATDVGKSNLFVFFFFDQ